MGNSTTAVASRPGDAAAFLIQQSQQQYTSPCVKIVSVERYTNRGQVLGAITVEMNSICLMCALLDTPSGPVLKPPQRSWQGKTGKTRYADAASWPQEWDAAVQEAAFAAFEGLTEGGTL